MAVANREPFEAKTVHFCTLESIPRMRVRFSAQISQSKRVLSEGLLARKRHGTTAKRLLSVTSSLCFCIGLYIRPKNPICPSASYESCYVGSATMHPLRVISLPLSALLACTTTLAESDARVGSVLSLVIDVYITITH